MFLLFARLIKYKGKVTLRSSSAKPSCRLICHTHEFPGGWTWKKPDVLKHIDSGGAASNIHIAWELDGRVIKDPVNKGFLKLVTLLLNKTRCITSGEYAIK